MNGTENGIEIGRKVISAVTTSWLDVENAASDHAKTMMYRYRTRFYATTNK